MELTPSQEETEKELEKKYQGVLTYVDSKYFLDATPYTSAKINGAIKRFRNAEGVSEPTTFVEMEIFVNDLADFWIDQNPEIHTQGEALLHESLSKYIAFSKVWKAKSKNLQIFTPSFMYQVGKMIVLKNTLNQAVKLINSRIAYDKCPNRALYSDFRDILPDAFTLLLPVINGLQTGSLTLPPGQTEDDLHRLIGAFFAGDKAVLESVAVLKQLEHKQGTSA